MKGILGRTERKIDWKRRTEEKKKSREKYLKNSFTLWHVVDNGRRDLPHCSPCMPEVIQQNSLFIAILNIYY